MKGLGEVEPLAQPDTQRHAGPGPHFVLAILAAPALPAQVAHQPCPRDKVGGRRRRSRQHPFQRHEDLPAPDGIPVEQPTMIPSISFPEALPDLLGDSLHLRELCEEDIPAWFARASDIESADLAGDPVPESIEAGALWLQRQRDLFTGRPGFAGRSCQPAPAAASEPSD